MAEAILDQSNTNSEQARQLLEDTEAILNGVSSGPLPVDPDIVQPEDLSGEFQLKLPTVDMSFRALGMYFKPRNSINFRAYIYRRRRRCFN